MNNRLLTMDEVDKIREDFNKLDLLFLSSNRMSSILIDEDEIDYEYERPENNGLYECKNNGFIFHLIREDGDDRIPTFTGNKGILFERAKGLTNKPDKYPFIVTGIIKFNDIVFKEETLLHEWAMVNSDEELEDFTRGGTILDILYFNIEDDIFNYWKEIIDVVHVSSRKSWENIVMRTIHLEGDILITDPCYWFKSEDWGKMEWDNNFRKFGISESICRDTIYGDWGCTTYNADTKEPIGTFCADSGMVSVCLLDEVRAYSGDKIDMYISNGSATVIKDFKGDIKFDIVDNYNLIVVGNGNINFVTSQTSL